MCVHTLIVFNYTGGVHVLMRRIKTCSPQPDGKLSKASTPKTGWKCLRACTPQTGRESGAVPGGSDRGNRPDKRRLGGTVRVLGYVPPYVPTVLCTPLCPYGVGYPYVPTVLGPPLCPYEFTGGPRKFNRVTA